MSLSPTRHLTQNVRWILQKQFELIPSGTMLRLASPGIVLYLASFADPDDHTNFQNKKPLEYFPAGFVDYKLFIFLKEIF